MKKKHDFMPSRIIPMIPNMASVRIRGAGATIGV